MELGGDRFPATVRLILNVMSEFKLNRNFNGSFAGETVFVPDHLDGEMVRNHIGVKVEKAEEPAPKNKAEKPPKNKAIKTTPRNKKN